MAIDDFAWDLVSGQIIDGYRVEERIGLGGFGCVFRAAPVVNDRAYTPVALKLIDKKIRNADRELRAVDTLNHEHILGRHKVGEWSFREEEFLYIAMPLAKDTLRRRIGRGPLPAHELASVAAIAGALQYMHEQRLVHRDLKPENVLLVDELWKVADFGAIRELTAGSGEFKSGQFTHQYAPPELIIEGPRYSFPYDIWALGVILLEAATGRHPFSEEDVFQIHLVTSSSYAPAIPIGLPESIRRIIAGCLERDPQQRWTAAQVCDVLRTPGAFERSFQEPTPSEPPQAPSPPRPQTHAAPSAASRPAPRATPPRIDPTPISSSPSGRGGPRSVGVRMRPQSTPADSRRDLPTIERTGFRLAISSLVALMILIVGVGYYFLTHATRPAADASQVHNNADPKISEPPSPIAISFAASPDRVHAGSSTTLSWRVQGAQRVQLDGNPVQLHGSALRRPESTTSYQLAVFGSGDKQELRSVTVQVLPPETAQMPPEQPKQDGSLAGSLAAPVFDNVEVVPNLARQCQIVVLRWTARNADSVSLDPDIGQAKPVDYRMVKPVETTKITLTASGPGGTTSKEIMVKVVPGPLSDCPR